MLFPKGGNSEDIDFSIKYAYRDFRVLPLSFRDV